MAIPVPIHQADSVRLASGRATEQGEHHCPDDDGLDERSHLQLSFVHVGLPLHQVISGGCQTKSNRDTWFFGLNGRLGRRGARARERSSLPRS